MAHLGGARQAPRSCGKDASYLLGDTRPGPKRARAASSWRPDPGGMPHPARGPGLGGPMATVPARRSTADHVNGAQHPYGEGAGSRLLEAKLAVPRPAFRLLRRTRLIKM